MSNEKRSIEQLALPLYQACGWLRLIALISILGGVLVGLTVVGLLLAWLPIWLGVLLYRTAEAAQTSFHSGDSGKLLQALNHLRRYFTLLGVVFLIWTAIVIWALLFHASVHWFFLWPRHYGVAV